MNELYPQDTINSKSEKKRENGNKDVLNTEWDKKDHFLLNSTLQLSQEALTILWHLIPVCTTWFCKHSTVMSAFGFFSGGAPTFNLII